MTTLPAAQYVRPVERPLGGGGGVGVWVKPGFWGQCLV